MIHSLQLRIALLSAVFVAHAACSSTDESTTSSSSTGTSSSTASTASSGAGSTGAGGAGGAGGRGGAGATTTASSSSTGTMMPFTLTSPDFESGKEMPADASCDGAGESPTLAWAGTPEGTTEFALLMTTNAKDGLKYNWVLHGIPAATTELPAGATGIGTAGLTSNGPNLAYAPPCSPGPGTKIYTFTLYALSGSPTLPADPKQVTGAVLATAIEPLILLKTSLDGAHTTP